MLRLEDRVALALTEGDIPVNMFLASEGKQRQASATVPAGAAPLYSLTG